MALYARADVSYVCVPKENGGCGEPHARPVIHGAPSAEFKLVCPACENFLRADIARTGSKKVRTVNSDNGLKLAERYLGQWGASPETVPETPDAEKQREWTADRTALENASTQTEAFGRIADALAGNQELLLKFAEMMGLRAALTPGSVPDAYGHLDKQASPTVPAVQGNVEARECLDCGAAIVRVNGQRGALAQRCPECKAKKAAARRKVA